MPNFHRRIQAEKPMATERMWSVIACFPSDKIKEDRQKHPEEQSLSPGSGKQLHVGAVMADRSTLQHLPQQSQELCQNRAWAYRLRWKNQNQCWFYFLLKTTYYWGQLKNRDSQQKRSINTHTADAKKMEMNSDDIFHTTKGLFGKTVSAWQEGTSLWLRN